MPTKIMPVNIVKIEKNLGQISHRGDYRVNENPICKVGCIFFHKNNSRGNPRFIFEKLFKFSNLFQGRNNLDTLSRFMSRFNRRVCGK